MPQINLNDLYVSMQDEMISRLNIGKIAIAHPGTKGDETESNWVEWFENYLPKRYKVDKGIIIDSNGKQSDQIDIIIYDTQYTYLVFKHDKTSLIPAESVYAVFETEKQRMPIPEYFDIRKQIAAEWLSNEEYQMINAPELAVYHWGIVGGYADRTIEIWIPIEKK